MEKLRNKECVFAWNNKYIFSTFIKKVCSKNLVDPHHFKIRTPKIPCAISIPGDVAVLFLAQQYKMDRSLLQQ
jgi:hypothetical protein